MIRKLTTLQGAAESLRWNIPPLRACTLAEALPDFGVPNRKVALALWWGDDANPLFAGMDWLDLIAVRGTEILVNRMIEPGAREQVIFLPADTPVLVFQYESEKGSDATS